VGQLYAEEAGAVFRAARKAAYDRREAEDCVQEAFRAAAVKWGEVAAYSPDKRRAWLCRVAINKAIDRYRTGKRMQLGADPNLSQAAPSAEEAVLTRIEKDRCMQVIKEMPPRRRTVAYLRWHEEWTVEEIAEHLGMAASTVRVHLRDARSSVTAALGDEVSVTEEPNKADDVGRKEAR
jgi:RNA polymerase sigma-70 factor (ECF subfamily)